VKQPGDFVGRFRIERLLGEGGIAEVYQVRHRQLGTVHALKLLTLHRPGQRARLLQEGQIQAQLRHPNLVAVTDVVDDDGQIGLVMEYVQGFSLADCLHEGGGMPLEDSLDLFQQVLEAVGTAHAAGVLHRDLKPHNILLTTQGDRVVAKVADFGIAKIASEGAGPGKTIAGTTMGTPGYMSPEQITDTAAVDLRTDIFALGAILYELLSGSRAFDGANQLEVLNNTAGGVYTPLHVHLPSCPQVVVEAIDRAMEVNPSDRFPNSESFAEALALAFELPSPVKTNRTLPPSPALPTRAPAPTLMPVEEDDDHEDIEDIEDFATEVTASPGRPPTNWGLEDAQIDQSLPPAHFDLLKQKMAAEHERRVAQRELDRERAENGEEDLDDASTHHVEGLTARVDGWLAAALWPLLRGFGGAVKFILGPGIGLAVLTLWAGRRGAELIEQARDEFEMAQTQLVDTLARELDMADQVEDLGARSEVLDPFRRRYEAAETDEQRIKAARELNDALLEEIRLLPSLDDPEQELARRNLELQLNDLGRKHDAYDLAAGHLEEEEATPFAQVALTFNMADD
jgi:serine/threonine protein kinase